MKTTLTIYIYFFKIFKSNTSLSGFIEKENRRESFSVFDKVDEVQPIKNYQENENLQPVLRCICSAIKLLLIGLKLTTGIFRRIIHMMKNINYKDSQK